MAELPILLPDGEPIPQGELDAREEAKRPRPRRPAPPIDPNAPRYKMKNFKRNVRVDLSDREIRIPREHNQNAGFREVRQPVVRLPRIPRIRGLNDSELLNVGFITFAVMAVFLMIYNSIHMLTGGDPMSTMIIACAINCTLTLIMSMLKHGIRSYHTWLWTFNTTIWIIQSINYA